MRPLPPLSDRRDMRPAETALALDLLRELDLLRLKAIARLYARGLPPDVAWDDLLQEAITRALTGSRRCPEGVSTVTFIAGIMRSLRADHWRRVLREQRNVPVLQFDREDDNSSPLLLADPTPGPERALIARQALTAIERLFSDDPVALRIIAGLGENLSAEQIRASNGLSRTDYDSARKRMRRALLRKGLTCDPD